MPSIGYETCQGIGKAGKGNKYFIKLEKRPKRLGLGAEASCSDPNQLVTTEENKAERLEE